MAVLLDRHAQFARHGADHAGYPFGIDERHQGKVGDFLSRSTVSRALADLSAYSRLAWALTAITSR